MAKLLVGTLLAGLLLIGFAISFTINIPRVSATEVIGIIKTDTIWTKANSPYALTGPLAVNTGVTLTIEAGVTVNLNNYYIQVNGTLIARGTPSGQISIFNGTLSFNTVSNGWNETTGSGCIVENADLKITLTSNIPLKIKSCSITTILLVGNSVVLDSI